MYKVLIVEDDPMVAMINEQYVCRHKSFSVVGKCKDGDKALKFINENPVDLIILDVFMPHTDGFETLRQLRKEQCLVDVIMVTAANDRESLEQGLHLGVVDYLVKPFGVMEMVARVNAVLRRTAKGSTTGEDVTVGKIILKEKEHKVIADSQKVELTHKEFEMLKLFMKNPNMVFSRDRLMSEIWGMDYVGETRTVDMHIKTLRQKLGCAGGQIKTVIGVGYKLGDEI